MSKRSRNNDDDQGMQAPGERVSQPKSDLLEDQDFEDPFEDEFDQEDQDILMGNYNGNNQMDDNDNNMNTQTDSKSHKPQPRVWRPGVDKMGQDEKLEYDNSAYTAYHKMNVEWPCLSFDIIPDALGMYRTKFPMTMYMAAGTQADQPQKNKVMLMKMSDIHKTYHGDIDDPDADNEDLDDLDDDPILEVKSFRHHGGVNRLRVMPQAPHILATQSDQKVVRVYDTKELLGALDKPPRKSLPPLKPVFTFKGHADEGYAMDWSRAVQGRMVTGDCSKFIYLWEPKQGGWAVNNIPYKGHTGSVEDLQWSPTEANVFISCSTDKTIRVWDTRCRTKSMLWVAAHKQDVNVVSWNKNVSHLLLSGSDDGSVKIWDLRNFKASEPAANFKWHRGAITSVDWHPTDESILAVSSADNSISVWDMGLEPDSDAASRGADVHGMEIPDQLLFVHQGQRDIKEVHFHPQIPSMIISTAGDGFNIFKPSNMQTLDENKR